MKNKNYLFLLAVLIILMSCAQNSDTGIPSNKNTNTENLTLLSEMPNSNLPGVDRSVFEGEKIGSQATSIECISEKTGYVYHKQTKALSLDNYNYIKYNLNIPIAKFSSNAFPYAYSGGDTKSGDGALLITTLLSTAKVGLGMPDDRASVCRPGAAPHVG